MRVASRWVLPGLCFAFFQGCGHSPAVPSASDPKAYAVERSAMVQAQLRARDIHDADVLDAMNRVPRHLFVPPELAAQAYADTPLPIGYQQTISQPYMVALMTQELKAKDGDRVLEVGTGSGYQAAVLCEVGAEVFSVEIVPELAESAAQRLASLGYKAHVRLGDGYLGWPEEAPFDAIIVTAAPDHLPEPLVQQLKEGGRLVIPLGPTPGTQALQLYEKREGQLQSTDLGPVRFVPLVRKR